MRIRVNRSLLLVGSALLLAVTCRAQQFPERDRFVETERDAILMPQPQFVAASDVMAVQWAPDGRSVLLVRTDPPPIEAALGARPASFETQLELWNRETRKMQLLWRTVNHDGPAMHSIGWLAKTHAALVTLEGPKPPPMPGLQDPEPPAHNVWLFRVDTRAKQVRVLAKLTEGTMVDPSPTQPTAIVAENETSDVRLLRPDGSFSAPIRLPEKRTPASPVWSNDGRAILVQGIRSMPMDPKPSVQYRVDATTLAAAVQDAPEPIQRQIQPPPFEWNLKQARSVLTDGNTRAAVSPLWLVSSFDSKHSQALIAPDARDGTLSPSGDAVLYSTEGGAWVMPLVRVDKGKFIEARNAALRQVTMSNAKQLGLAAIMYSQDYDEILPGSNQDIRNILLPYCKAEQLFNGFVYTFPGGALKDIPEPSKQELGFIPGPGGRALLFADGHVEWKGDMPPPAP